MATIAEVRQKFPQYSDLSDEQLAQGLHKKYYSDLPYEDFAQRVGLQQEPQQPTQPQAPAAEPGWLDSVKADLANPREAFSPKALASAAVRPIVKAGTAIPGIFADAAMGAYNLATGQSNELPTQATNRVLDEHTIKPQGLGRAAEVVSETLIGSKIPLPSVGKQAPRGFVPPDPELTATQQTFKQARSAGYVVPPATLKPTVGNVAAESVAGKAAVQQLASRKNQRVTNSLVAKGLGLGEDTQLTPKVLDEIRKKSGRVYDAVAKSGEVVTDPTYLDDLAAISKQSQEIAASFPDANVGKSAEVENLINSLLRDKFDSKAGLEYLKELRKAASANLSGVNAADPAKVALGRAQRDAASALEDQVMRHLESQGKGALAGAFDKARVLIAKTYSAEKALNPATGNINARALATELKRGKPLSGEFETVAKFAAAFPKAADEVLTSPGVSALDAALTAGGATTLSATGGLAVAPIALAWPAARFATRQGLLTDTMQNRLLPQAPRFLKVDPAIVAGGAAATDALR